MKSICVSDRELVRDSGESLLVVLNDILDYSKIESGQMELEWKPFRLDEAVEKSVRLLGPKAQEKNVRIAGNVLVWAYGSVTLRIEGPLTRAQALGLAASIR